FETGGDHLPPRDPFGNRATFRSHGPSPLHFDWGGLSRSRIPNRLLYVPARPIRNGYVGFQADKTFVSHSRGSFASGFYDVQTRSMPGLYGRSMAPVKPLFHRRSTRGVSTRRQRPFPWQDNSFATDEGPFDGGKDVPIPAGYARALPVMGGAGRPCHFWPVQSTLAGHENPCHLRQPAGRLHEHRAAPRRRPARPRGHHDRSLPRPRRSAAFQSRS